MRHYKLSFLFLLLFSLGLSAQETYPGFKMFTQQFYTGGLKAFSRDIVSTVNYPLSDRRAGVTGVQRVRVWVSPGQGLRYVETLEPIVSPTIASEVRRAISLTRGSWNFGGSTGQAFSEEFAIAFTMEGIEEFPGTITIVGEAVDPSEGLEEEEAEATTRQSRRKLRRQKRSH